MEVCLAPNLTQFMIKLSGYTNTNHILSTSWPNKAVLHHLGISKYILQPPAGPPPTRGAGFLFRHPLGLVV